MPTFCPSDIGPFAQHMLGVPLYPYQLEIAEAILDSIAYERGQIFTVMMARQSGKNQLSAVLEAFLLAHTDRGTVVKAAPTFNPQIQHSRLRLMQMLGGCELGARVWQSNGRIVGLAPNADAQARRNQLGPRVTFFSAAPESNVVGATADLLLEIDEAQDVASDKFDRDFRPMCSTTAATTVLYGTAWSDQTLLAQQRAVNLARQQQSGPRAHFEHDWRTLAALNPRYRAFVEQEIARLGEEHVAIQTQYFLRPINGLERLLNARQLGLLQGEYTWEAEPGEDLYVAGMDIGGEDLASPGALVGLGSSSPSRHDSTVISLARVRRSDLQLPLLEVVHLESWTGMSYAGQLAATVKLLQDWHVRTLVVDATGLGGPLASMLRERLGEERVRPFLFTRASKSRLAYQFLAFVNGGQLKLCVPGQRQDAQARQIWEECWRQLKLAKSRFPAPNVLDMYVEPGEGHDDMLMSLALLTEAVGSGLTPLADSSIVRAKGRYSGEGRF